MKESPFQTNCWCIYMKKEFSAWNRNQDDREWLLGIVMLILLFISMILIAKEASELRTSGKKIQQGKEKKRVVIDAGHGAADSGKIAINGALEKDLNLSIAKRVQELLQAQNVEVYMTREDDKGFYPSVGSNKKVQDMKKRVEYINRLQADLTVSIHQNSFRQEEIAGAQVFYYGTSKEGKMAAEIMQDQMIATLDKENKRVAKNNNSYYLLKRTSSPIIIVECGFLSNRKEAQLLITPLYQEKAAWAIHLGILRYLNQQP